VAATKVSSWDDAISQIQQIANEAGIALAILTLPLDEERVLTAAIVRTAQPLITVSEIDASIHAAESLLHDLHEGLHDQLEKLEGSLLGEPKSKLTH
jgi:hypothetical protein